MYHLFLIIRLNFRSLKTGEKYDTINIFSLASGHLYERFLRIMMLSVMKNTEHPVKFWLLKNYLSPQFKVRLVFCSYAFSTFSRCRVYLLKCSTMAKSVAEHATNFQKDGRNNIIMKDL